ncbi:DJ-1/PfpI family protein [Psychrobacter sp.]|uniref:DJ-1/PfpI family protein n=1 Tax=Psychrobacter sp. TaxID=56811 RepID=UPI0025FAC4BB|nr:DJ-1/PfpI family protein [Psychrobacter sp.]
MNIPDFNLKDKLEKLNIKEALNSVKDALGFEPQEIEEGIYIPSESSLKLAAPNKSNYDDTEFDSPYTGNKKILMVCTEEQYMTMANDRKFKTGNQPIEMMVPMLHFKKAGFDVDVFTATGKPVQIEDWAMPNEDDNVKAIYDEYKERLEKPNSLAELVKEDLAAMSDYAAIFIPGGHGAMLGLPDDKNLGEILRWVHKNDLLTLVICHGPAALLAASLDNDDHNDNHNDNDANNNNSASTDNANMDFIFKGYDIVAFPDVMDKQMPKMGYLPGDMPWYFNEKLEDLGVTVTNKLASGHTHQDRKLISGDGPLAANELGKLAVKELLSTVK